MEVSFNFMFPFSKKTHQNFGFKRFLDLATSG